MTSQQHTDDVTTTTVFTEEEEEDDDSEDDHDHLTSPNPNPNDDLIEDDEEEEVEDDSTSSGAGEVTIAVAGTTSAVAATPVTSITTENRTVNVSSSDVDVKVIDQRKITPFDDSQRRLFQRLWTDEDEIELLNGFYEYNTQKALNNNFNNNHHHNDTTAFYDLIKNKLQLDFNKNQLVEKLRRLKKKYRNVISKISSGKEYIFKSQHDQITFDISSKIWSNDGALVSTPIVRFDDDDANNVNPNLNVPFNLNESSNGNGAAYLNSEKKVSRSRKRSRSGGVKVEEKVIPTTTTPAAVGGSNLNSNLVEETVKSCLLPLFKELVESSRGGGMKLDPFGLSFGGMMNLPFGDMNDEKWRKQHILELEVCSKRLELVQDQIKSQLEELRSVRR